MYVYSINKTNPPHGISLSAVSMPNNSVQIPDVRIKNSLGNFQSAYNTPGLFARMIRAEIYMSRLPKAKIYNIISCDWMYTNEYTEQIKDIHMPNNFESLYKAFMNLRKKTK